MGIIYLEIYKKGWVRALSQTFGKIEEERFTDLASKPYKEINDCISMLFVQGPVRVGHLGLRLLPLDASV